MKKKFPYSNHFILISAKYGTIQDVEGQQVNKQWKYS